ncbi:hypothetical protein BH09VER1_BH09VER1_30620 [soil metagenome]
MSSSDQTLLPPGCAGRLVRRLWSRPACALFGCLALGVLAFALLFSLYPAYSNSLEFAPGQPARAFAFPFLQEKTASRERLLTFTMKLGRFHPTQFVAYARDLIGVIEVNSHIVVDFTQPPTLHEDARLDLSPWLHPGDNLIRVKIVNLRPVSYFDLRPSLADPLLLALLALALASLAFGLRGLHLLRPAFLGSSEALILLAALGLRLLYLCGTPNSIRSYDWEGHLQYVQYVATHLALPPFDLGWETFQPPLFYVIFGLIGRLVFALGGSYHLAIVLWQLASFALSGLTLFVALWISHLLFPGPVHRWRLWFLAGLAALPGFVIFSSWISNDILFALLSFAFLAAFLSFWRSPRWRPWLAVSVITGLGLLTKSNALVFVPIVFMTVLLATGLSWMKKARYLAVFLALVCLVAGWFLARRALESRDSTSFVIASLEGLGPEQKITPTPATLLCFNPVEMLRQPFTWIGGNPRKDRSPEFFLKTALFGEWRQADPFLPLARGLLGCALLLLPFAAWGAFVSPRSTSTPAWPLAVTTLGFVSAQLAWLLKAPFACHQNFRLSIVLLIPIFYFLVRGLEASPWPFRQLGLLIFALFLGASLLFVLFLV